jgi:ankyrin repeat protein
MLEVLIQAGANLDVVDPLGTSALDLAKEFQHDKVFKLIQETLSQKKLSKEFESKTEVVNDNFDKFRFYPKGEQDCQSELQSVKHPDEEEKDPQFKKVR